MAVDSGDLRCVRSRRPRERGAERAWHSADTDVNTRKRVVPTSEPAAPVGEAGAGGSAGAGASGGAPVQYYNISLSDYERSVVPTLTGNDCVVQLGIQAVSARLDAGTPPLSLPSAQFYSSVVLVPGMCRFTRMWWHLPQPPAHRARRCTPQACWCATVMHSQTRPPHPPPQATWWWTWMRARSQTASLPSPSSLSSWS